MAFCNFSYDLRVQMIMPSMAKDSKIVALQVAQLFLDQVHQAERKTVGANCFLAVVIDVKQKKGIRDPAV